MKKSIQEYPYSGNTLFKTSLFLLLSVYVPQSAEATDFKPHWHEWHAPVTTDAHYILAGGLLSTSVTYFNRGQKHYSETRSYIEARPLRRWGVVGSIIGLGGLNGGYALYHLLFSKEYSQAAFMTKATLYPMTWVLLLKGIVKERRPGFQNDRQSFPSGHAAASFAFSSAVAIQHGWKWGALAYTLASFIAITRINDDYHYLHDVLAGASLGASYAWGLYFQEKQESRAHTVNVEFFKGQPMLTWRYSY